jgi:hypothetical protein
MGMEVLSFKMIIIARIVKNNNTPRKSLATQSAVKQEDPSIFNQTYLQVGPVFTGTCPVW